MRRAALFCAALAAACLVCFAVWWRVRDASPPAGPLPVPEGRTTRQTLPDWEGKPEVWTLSRREVPREERAAPPLPEAAPRESPPDEVTDSARALDARALEAWKQGDLWEAIDLFKAAVAADPDDWLPRSDYGRLLLLMTDTPGARPQLERAAQLAPENPRVWLDLLSLYERTAALERAFEARRRARETAGGRAIVQDPKTGLWMLEGDSIYP